MSFLAALRFLTIIPTGWWRENTPEEISRSTVYFPVVGLIIGLGAAALGWLLGLVLPPIMVKVLLLIYLVVISGALHIDGLIDTCDGIAGHKTVEERWRIMHDSRAGAFGIVGAVLLLLLKYVSLLSVPERLLPATLVLMPVASRWTMVYAIFGYPYARIEGLGRLFKQGANLSRFLIATLITLAMAIGLAWWARVVYFYIAGPAVVVGVWLIAVAVATFLKRKLSGLNGDTYGAINEVAEVGVLVMVSLLVYK